MIRKILFYRFLFASTLWVMASCSSTSRGGADEQGKVKEQIRQWLLGIEDYRIVAEVSMQDIRTISRITGRIPNRLRMELEIQRGSKVLTERVVFDGTYQWIESTDQSESRVAKIKVAELTDQTRPFDTSYYLTGSGLLNGEDFPTTIATLLSIYDLEVIRTNNRINLFGPINSENFRQYVSARKSGRSKEVAIKKFTQTFRYLKMEFDGSNKCILRRYSLGPSPDQPSFLVVFLNVEINQKIPENAFKYSPPPGSHTEDITQQLKQEDGR